jgi:hypothetical protein
VSPKRLDDYTFTPNDRRICLNSNGAKAVNIVGWARIQWLFAGSVSSADVHADLQTPEDRSLVWLRDVLARTAGLPWIGYPTTRVELAASHQDTSSRLRLRTRRFATTHLIHVDA